MSIFLSDDKMVKIELEDDEEVIKRTVSKYGRIEGLKRWVGRPVRLIILKKDDKECKE